MSEKPKSGNRRGRVEGLSAIVTGGSRGIGRATSIALAREGAKVVVNYSRSSSKAEEVLDVIKRSGGEAFSFKADVSDRAAVQEMVGETMKRFGGVDILVNNAGIGGGGGSMLELKEGDLDALMNTNVKGMLFCCQNVAPHMIKNHYGKIVNIASVAGIGTALTGTTLYATTKAAVIILTKRFAVELGQHHINVNAIAPGHILTDMTVQGRSPDEVRKRSQYFEEHTMLRREGEPEDIANAALFLSSDEASFITGQILAVDGGRTDFLTHSL